MNSANAALTWRLIPGGAPISSGTSTRPLRPSSLRERRHDSFPPAWAGSGTAGAYRISADPHEVKSLAVASGAAHPEAIDSQSLICLASLIWAVTPAQACVAVSSFQDPLGGFLLSGPAHCTSPQ